MDHETVLKFWFEESGPRQWFAKDDAFDAEIGKRFGDLLERASRCELHEWRADPSRRLAEIIVLDQFSRNVHHDTPDAFASDPLSLCLTQEAVRSGADRQLPIERRAFVYIPIMHSESLAIHEWGEPLFATLSEKTRDSSSGTRRSSNASAATPTATAFSGGHQRPKSWNS